MRILALSRSSRETFLRISSMRAWRPQAAHNSDLHHRCFFASAATRQGDPIVIIGGGPTGLLVSNLLSLYDVPSVLLEAQTTESRFRHPQAHFLNTRTMEILRHWLPETYTQVRQAMPPVEQWKSFRFTHDMSAEPMVEVVHPVDLPLQANLDANGVLRQDVTNSANDGTALSCCAVGHLAQHTFCQILHDAAVENAVVGTRLLYDTPVKRVHREVSSGQLLVETDEDTFAPRVCIAADGSNSMIRRQEGVEMLGQEGIQHLVNIHVTLPAEQAAQLHRNGNYGMLYFVLNEAVVATVVCHSVGEYIIQIPYFPPYQTIENDFGPDKLPSILQTIFGVSVSKWDIRSVKSWTMSSLIADEFHSGGDIALVGDAAHIFPPAGGFGMNTGLQDVHNLAWKLAWVIHNDRSKDDLKRVLKSYGSERRPVAVQNAALSVRNYHRLLEVTKSCYLNDKHPSILRRVLDVSPLPLTARQAVFQSLLKTALHPLSWLQQPDSMYAKHIQRNLCRVLRTGTGLPLLFPRFEIGFGYPSRHANGETRQGGTHSSDWRQDTTMDAPTIEVGRLLPHVEVQVVSKARGLRKNLHYLSLETISTSDLPAQVACDKLPTFVVVGVGELDNPTLVEELCRGLSEKIGLPVMFVQLDGGPAGETSLEGIALALSSGSVALQNPSAEGRPYLALVRPDGHVASVSTEIADKEALQRRFYDDAVASLLFHVDVST